MRVQHRYQDQTSLIGVLVQAVLPVISHSLCFERETPRLLLVQRIPSVEPLPLLDRQKVDWDYTCYHLYDLHRYHSERRSHLQSHCPLGRRHQSPIFLYFRNFCPDERHLHYYGAVSSGHNSPFDIRGATDIQEKHGDELPLHIRFSTGLDNMTSQGPTPAEDHPQIFLRRISAEFFSEMTSLPIVKRIPSAFLLP